MKLKVKIGSVRTDNAVYTVGQMFEAGEADAKSFLREGIAEKFEDVQVVAKPEVKAEVKPEKPKVEKKVAEKPKVEEVKPSIDWTAKEILEYGISKGFEDLEGKTKAEMLAEIEGGEKL